MRLYQHATWKSIKQGEPRLAIYILCIVCMSVTDMAQYIQNIQTTYDKRVLMSNKAIHN